jgi:MoxR-like ATPase
MMRPDRYLADSGLVDACNVALLLRQPLLLTGEPGTGKTLFASSLAWELGLGHPLKFETKSTSVSNELFYHYDTLRHFQDVQCKRDIEHPVRYITYHALGTAIVRTRKQGEVASFVPADFEHGDPCRSVVLIDEIDKAPRDFPNDVLNELELMYFRVPELGNVKIEANSEFEPIVVITSNSEKDLPDAFLRRCIYYHIPFPDRERLEGIVANRLGSFSGGASEFLDAALDFFFELRDPAQALRKKPATAELLAWILTLRELAEGRENPLTQPELVPSACLTTAAWFGRLNVSF